MYKEATKHKRGHHNEIDLHNDVEKIKAALADATRDLKGKAGDFYSESMNTLREKSVNIENDVSDYVVENPFKSIGIALAVGFALGFLLRK